MNMHDSEHLAGVLELSGYTGAADIVQADIVIYNTCMVRQSAEDKAWGQIEALSSLNGSALLAVCGCMAERYGVDIMSRCPGVDLVFGLHSIARLAEMLEKSSRARLCDLGNINRASIDELPSKRANPSAAWVPVSHGCDRFCSYCVVPLVRGRERSRPPGEVTEEVQRLASAGVFEITLLGQNVNSYGRGLDGTSFAGLLESVACVPGIRRVKFETSHPGDLSDSILVAMSGRAEVCEYLHLPVQSGSNDVLSAMGRGYDRDYYLQRVERARELVPGVVISTDIMVGFPGETDGDFQGTMDLVRAVGFDAAFMFMYSRREGTAAASIGNEVPQVVKAERLKALSRLQARFTRKSLVNLVGSTVELLVEGVARSGEYVVGRTRGHQVVLLPSFEAPLYSLVEAYVPGAGSHAARGRVKKVIREPPD
ncbi:MAG: tRNA (N6-isopentenyl adenosine(37)-C2)-methylthiotransferase MiaB [Actinobacteria bacterium]|nr:tRNA (N6-isopentenyl adenosine(37)-C2)-methylthiotransferase MiaB [Actinomycetota bacterium]MBU4489190.1 tRNA (N6-isopentenyl adenosine(37)-C2)-methylthiotransferase MiaB [Actinomycetota bacterium]